MIEPFTETKVKEYSSFDELKEKQAENQRKSLARTRKMVNLYSRCWRWEWFVTFTFNPSKIDRTDFQTCMKKIRNWLQNARQKIAPNMKYLIVPELHSDMVSWHLHGLLADVGDMCFTNSGKKVDKQAIYNISNWKWGFSTATKVQDTYRVQKYITKYITKESHALSFGAHRYYVSNNLPKPKQSTMLIEPQEQSEVIEQIANSLGLDIVWISNTYSTPYTNVTYIELQ